MKKIVLFVILGLITGSLWAQDPGAVEKNAGNDAWKAKNYALAFTNFEKYLQIVKFADKPYIYNTAVAASKAKNYVAAEKYFDMAIKNNYKVGNAYLGKAQAEEDQGKGAEMVATLEQGLKAVPGNAKLESMYGSYFLKNGVEAQKANDVAKAAENYVKATTLTDKGLKVQGLMALGSLYFNNGAATLQKATPIANTDKEKYEAEKTKAAGDFKKALDYAAEALKIQPENTELKDLMTQIKGAMK